MIASNSQAITRGKAECNFECYRYEYNYSLTLLTCVRFSRLTLRIAMICVPIEACLIILTLLYSSSMIQHNLVGPKSEPKGYI